MAAVIGPLQQRLPLLRPAKGISRFVMLAYLRGVTPKRPPPRDLAAILARHPPPRIIAAIPLKPAARIVGMDPALLDPDAQRHAGTDAEIAIGRASCRESVCQDV